MQSAKPPKNPPPEFRGQSFLQAIWMAILVGILFYTIVIAAVAFVAPWHNLTGEKFMTAVAFERAVGSRWIVNVILVAALLSLVKCFNGNFIAASRLVFALGRRGLVDARAGRIHSRHQTPSIAVVCVGLATGACMLLGDAILVPDHRSRLGCLRDRMGRDLCRLSVPAAQANLARLIGSVGCGIAGCRLGTAGRDRHDADESDPRNSRSFYGLRMDRAHHLDRAGRARAPWGDCVLA
jgi:hypothetical protein